MAFGLRDAANPQDRIRNRVRFRSRPWRTRTRIVAAILLVPAAAMLSACTSGGAGDPDHERATPSASPSPDGTGDPVPDGVPARVEFDALLAEPTAYLGQRIEVLGTVFFLAKCPPPGSTPADCELAGYLTAPGTTSFIASDASRAIALAEGGALLSCPEGTGPAPACGDWRSAAAYVLEGVIAHQVLGGRESELVQLDVSAKELASAE